MTDVDENDRLDGRTCRCGCGAGLLVKEKGTGMDVLSDVLGAVKMSGTLYFTTEFTAPWGVRVPSFGRVARFHLAVRGRCWIEVEGMADPVLLESGDLAVIPHGAEHLLADEPGAACRSVDEVVRRSGFDGTGTLVYGGEDEGHPTRMVCGHFAFDGSADHPFLSSLPPLIVVRWREYVDYAPLADVFSFIVREVREARPGTDAIIRRLSEILFIEAVRFWAERDPHASGIMAALADPRVGPSLRAIHEEPGKGWTLESLARTAALGRTAFSVRFRELVGMTPLQYLSFWRIQRAKELLLEPRLSVEAVASKTGYASTPAFSRVFKKWVGLNPGAYRKSARAGTSAGA